MHLHTMFFARTLSGAARALIAALYIHPGFIIHLVAAVYIHYNMLWEYVVIGRDRVRRADAVN